MKSGFGSHCTREGTRFDLTAPRAKRVDLVLESPLSADEHQRVFPMTHVSDGLFSTFVPGVGAGARYRYRLDGGPLRPDPASRFQPEGPHGPSESVDPKRFEWTDGEHTGPSPRGVVLYELHVGTFTREGTFAAATAQLPHLSDLGVTVIELMPVAEFPGEFGWGYDGVALFAPFHGYGTPDDLRRLIDVAHRLGMSIILDVVYNHFGPDGNYLRDFYPRFFSEKSNDWGEGIDFDGEDSRFVRAFYRANVAHWITEYHLDGLRLDATQDMHDASAEHVVSEIVRTAREAADPRRVLIYAENELQRPELVRPRAEGGLGCDGVWNDDFHHAARVAATGRHEAYYGDTRGTAQELVSAVKWGYLFQGQRHDWKKGVRGAYALDLPAERFLTYLQNHDQVANSARGARLWQCTSPGRARAMRVLHLLAPGTPLLFQGEEYEAQQPFLYFADHAVDLAKQVAEGRLRALEIFPSARDPRVRELLPDPHARATFERCKLDRAASLAEHQHCREALTLTRDLLALRREDQVFSAQNGDRLHGAVLADEALVLRFFGPDRFDDRLIVVNLGRDLERASLAEPLLAPSPGGPWRVILSSEDPAYGGSGTPPMDQDGRVLFPGQCALVFAPETPLRG